MPKYCAAATCCNRSGQLSTDSRKLSFYPFPLQDKERLHKWIVNMKREKWFPKRYQCICSDHFTADSFEWRWGIRYLKPDAVPTVFLLPTHLQGKKQCFRAVRRKNVSSEETAETKLSVCGLTGTDEITPLERLEVSVTVKQTGQQFYRKPSLSTVPPPCIVYQRLSAPQIPTEPLITRADLETSHDEMSIVAEVLQLEHSYCRQDLGKAQLWEKISKLQRKVEELEQQEQRTVARLKSMEHLIEQLKQENLISEEKLKVMENCLTTFELTVLQ